MSYLLIKTPFHFKTRKFWPTYENSWSAPAWAVVHKCPVCADLLLVGRPMRQAEWTPLQASCFCNTSWAYAFLHCASLDWLTTSCLDWTLQLYIAQLVCNIIYWFDNAFGIKTKYYRLRCFLVFFSRIQDVHCPLKLSACCGFWLTINPSNVKSGNMKPLKPLRQLPYRGRLYKTINHFLITIF